MPRRFSTFGRAAAWGAAALLAVLLIAPDLAAQAGNLRVTLFGGGSFLKADRTFPAEGRTYDSSFAAGGRAGLRATLDLTGHLSAEGSYSYGASNLRIADLGAVPPAVTGYGVRVQQIDANLLYFFTMRRGKFRPFATFGAGIARLAPTSRAKAAAAQEFIAGPATLSSGNKFDVNYGFGVEEKLVPHLGLRFDLRDHVIAVPRLGAPPGPGSAGAGFFPVSGIVHILNMTVGIVIYASR